jgi:hypothetical protein
MHFNGKVAMKIKFKTQTIARSPLAILVVLGLAVIGQRPVAAGTWTALANTAPDNVELMLVLPDGTIMGANAFTSGGNYGKAWYRLTPDSSGSYQNGAWTTRATAANTRLWCGSQVLKDGRVFTAGGEYGDGPTTSEIYDPVGDSWTTLPSAGVTDFVDPPSILLPDGRVLIYPVTHGSIANGTKIYDPIANSWINGPACLASQNESTWVKLPDDSILTVDKNSTLSERYIPSLNKWVRDATVPVNLYGVGSETGPAFLLPDGRAFFVGGVSNTALYTPSPLGGTNAGSWVAGPNIPSGRAAPDAGGCMMVNGKILLAVSQQGTVGNTFPTPTYFYEYDYTVGATGSFTQVNSPTGGLSDNIPSYRAVMVALPDGNVLYSHFDNQLYVYQPTGAAISAAKPSISTVNWRGNGTVRVTGTKFNGIGSGASYGDDAQMDSNFPLIRFTTGGSVYYGRTHDWTSTGVATGSEGIATELTLPSQLNVAPNTAFSMSVVANGVASTGVTFYGPVWVDFNYSGLPFELGWYTFPWNTMAEGVSAVTTGGTIAIKASSRNEPITISKAMTIISVGGSAVIGH